MLVKEPYFNEAGYDARAGSSYTQSISQHYSEKACSITRDFILSALQCPSSPFSAEIDWLYRRKEGPQLLDAAINDLAEMTAQGSSCLKGGLQKVSKGAIILFKRKLGELEDVKKMLLSKQQTV